MRTGQSDDSGCGMRGEVMGRALIEVMRSDESEHSPVQHTWREGGGSTRTDETRKWDEGPSGEVDGEWRSSLTL